MSVNIGLPHSKRPAFIKTLSIKQPLSRVSSGIAIMLPGEIYEQRKRDLMESIRFSRQYIKVIQWNADKLPEVRNECYDIIQAEQRQIRATFNDLVALKRWLNERVEYAQKNGLSD